MIELLKSIPYAYPDGIQPITEITHAVLLKRVNIDRTFLYKDIFIHAGETAESISHRLYGDVRFAYSIWMVNSIIDPYAGMPMDFDLLVEYTKEKYGDAYALHWFIDARDGRICDDRSSIKYREQYAKNELPEYIIPVSHLDYEREQNESKHKIRVVNPAFIQTFDDIIRSMV